MRILHTSDWHLGKRFTKDFEILDRQAEFGEWLLGVVKEKKIDVVVIAGDLFQVVDPPIRAVNLWWSVAKELNAAGVEIVGISGNHDSGERVGGGEPIFGKAGITLRGDPARVDVPVTISDEHGEVQFFPIPFLQPILTGAVLGVPEGRRNHESVLQAAVNKVNAVKHSGRTVLIAHAFVTGGETSESEDLLVGGTAQVSLSMFAGFTYTALGHLHQHQAWDNDRIAYSGSPLPYSFSETKDKCVRIITLDANGICDVEIVPCTVGRKVKTLKASLEELKSSPTYSEFEDHFIYAKLTDKVASANVFGQLQQRFPYICRMEFVGLADVELQKVKRGDNDPDRVKNFLTEVLGDRLTEKHVTTALNELAIAMQGETKS